MNTSFRLSVAALGIDELKWVSNARLLADEVWLRLIT